MHRTLAIFAALALAGACAESNTSSTDAAIQGDGSVADAGSACLPRWRTLVADRELRDLVRVGDKLYVAGSSGTAGWIGEMDGCRGTFSDQVAVSHATATETTLLQMVSGGDDLYVAGFLATSADPGEGLFARVTTAPLSVTSTEALSGSAGKDSTHAIARAASGDLWMTGAADSGATPALWGVKATTAGAACGFTGPAPATAGRGVVVLGNDVYVFADSEGHALVAHYNEPACTVNPCACVPTWTSTFEVGTASTIVLAAEGGGARLYAAGMAAETGAAAGDLFGFVVELNPVNGAVVGTYTWDPTVSSDAFTGLAADGDSLLAIGGSGWDGISNFDNTSSSVHRIPAALSGTPTAEWVASPASTLLWSVVTGQADEFYAVGLTTDGASVVLRCDSTGSCGE